MLLNPRIIIDRVIKKVLSYVSYKKKKRCRNRKKKHNFLYPNSLLLFWRMIVLCFLNVFFRYKNTIELLLNSQKFIGEVISSKIFSI